MGTAPQHALTVHGAGAPTVLLGHGLGGTQRHWDPVVEALVHHGLTAATFDLTGSGRADPALFSPSRHQSVMGFADDLAALCADAGLRGIAYVGHSMSGMAGALAAAADPGLFTSLVMMGSSACYIDHPDDGYVGGFSPEAVDHLLTSVRADFELWSAGFAPLVMMNDERPEFALEFARSLRQYRPDVADTVFRAAFLGDFRDLVARVVTPTLVLQTKQDAAVPLGAARWLADHIPTARLEIIDAVGHFPHVVAPEQLVSRLVPFLLGNPAG